MSSYKHTNEVTIDYSFELYDLVLSGLIALAFKRLEKNMGNNSSSETLFLGKWLKRVKKQQLYPKKLANEINRLLSLYANKGLSANLTPVFIEIYKEFKIIKKVSLQSSTPEKIRFDAAMGILAENGWYISLPIAQDQSKNKIYRATKPKEVFTSEFYWNRAFDDDGKLTKEISIFVVSPPQEVIDTFYLQGFILIKGLSSPDIQGKYYYQYILFPDNRCTGEPAMPSELIL